MHALLYALGGGERQARAGLLGWVREAMRALGELHADAVKAVIFGAAEVDERAWDGVGLSKLVDGAVRLLGDKFFVAGPRLADRLDVDGVRAIVTPQVFGRLGEVSLLLAHGRPPAYRGPTPNYVGLTVVNFPVHILLLVPTVEGDVRRAAVLEAVDELKSDLVAKLNEERVLRGGQRFVASGEQKAWLLSADVPGGRCVAVADWERVIDRLWTERREAGKPFLIEFRAWGMKGTFGAMWESLARVLDGVVVERTRIYLDVGRAWSLEQLRAQVSKRMWGGGEGVLVEQVCVCASIFFLTIFVSDRVRK